MVFIFKKGPCCRYRIVTSHVMIMPFLRILSNNFEHNFFLMYSIAQQGVGVSEEKYCLSI